MQKDRKTESQKRTEGTMKVNLIIPLRYFDYAMKRGGFSLYRNKLDKTMIINNIIFDNRINKTIVKELK
jgi:hypothetical protein